jgi:phage tail-like protein
MPETGARNDPFPGFRFVLELGSVPAGGFSECSGLDLEIETEDYAEGGENRFVHKLPGRRKQSNIVLKRGLAGSELWRWFMDQNAGTVRTTSVSLVVQQFDTDGPSLNFEIHDAFPVRWQGPQLDAGQSAVATETLTLAHQGLKLRG